MQLACLPLVMFVTAAKELLLLRLPRESEPVVADVGQFGIVPDGALARDRLEEGQVDLVVSAAVLSG